MLKSVIIMNSNDNPTDRYNLDGGELNDPSDSFHIFKGNY